MGLPVSALRLTIAAVLLSSLPVQAHHSVQGEFDLDDRITLTGTVSEVVWVNPHAYVHLDVKNDDGTVTTWALETGPIARMRRGGLTKQALAGKPGEQVTAVGMPALREGNNSIWLIKIAYEDGKYYILYPSPVELPAKN
jgi:hypothetical protein